VKRKGGIYVAVQFDGPLRWRKSSYSGDSANCIEVAEIPSGRAVRDSKNPDGPILSYTVEAWRAFIAEVRQGLFDRPRY
jgi:hypothetical protein